MNYFQNQNLKIQPIKIPYVNKEITPRYIMQVYGTEVMRDLFNENYWVDQVIGKILKSDKENHILSDLRFPNEIQRMKEKLSSECSNYTVRLNRSTGKNDTHPSETSLDDYTSWDYIVDNNYDKDSFRLNIVDIYNHIIYNEGEKWIQQYS